MRVTRHASLLASTLLASSLIALPALAQVGAQPSGNSKTAVSDGLKPTPTAEVQDDSPAIVVTGSRIRQPQFTASSPVEIYTRDEALLAGFNSTTDLLQGTAVTGGSAQINNAFGGFVTNGGPGANTLSLRGLGPTRTLVLLDGHRVAPAGSRGSVGSADLNVLPTAMVDRVEILRDGASSVYGSDAVAGVVNIITMKKVEGLTVEAQLNPTQHGGGMTSRVSAVFGITRDRLKLSGSVEYYERDNLTLADRDWTTCNTDYRRINGSSPFGSLDYVDPRTGQPKCYPITGTGSNGVTINAIGTSNTAATPAQGVPAGVTLFNRLRPNAAVTGGSVVGYEGVGAGAISGFNLNIRDTFEPRMLNRSLISPVKVKTGYVKASYETDVLGNAEPYVEILGNRRDSSQVGYRQLSLDYIKGSPLIPANLAFSTFSGPVNTSNGQNVGVRAFIGFGNDKSSQRVDFVKVAGGVRGDFFFKDWRYDLYAAKTWSTAVYKQQSFLTDRLAQSLDVVSNGAGGFNCRVQTNGCVAAPALTAAVVGGQLPQAWVNYVFQDVQGKTKFGESVVSFNVDGPIFKLPYGDLSASLGLEYRKDSIDDTPDINSQTSNLYNLTSSAITRGKDRTFEAFGEIEVPLLADLPFAKELSVNGSGRYTHYRSYGADETYKFSGRYAPVKWFTVRGTYGTSYRAPALFEQFVGATSGFLSSTIDPCNNYTTGTIRGTNCAADGIATGFNQTSSVTVLTQGGANAGLKAETSKNMTIGGVFQPKLGNFGELSFAIDYYRIKVNNEVSRAGASAILQLCYDNPSFRGGGGYCNLVTRNPVSNALTVSDSYINLATQIVRGIDYTIRYSKKFGDYTLRLSGQLTNYLEQSNKLFKSDPLIDYNGLLNTPKWTGTGDAVLQWKKIKFRYGVEWIQHTSSYDYYQENPATSTYQLATPDYFLHNTSVQFDLSNYSLTLGVQNLFDKNPPMISQGVLNRVGNAPLYSGYDYFGRRFFVNVKAKF